MNLPKAVPTSDNLDDKRRFLTHFDSRQRAFVSNLFLKSVRSGKSAVYTVMKGVRAYLDAQCAYLNPNSQAFARNENVLDKMDAYLDEAVDLAMWAIEWEQLPAEEKDAIKRERSAPYWKKAMEGQPPTDKQIKYLRALGWTGEIDSKRHASELIDQLLKRDKPQNFV